MNNNNKDGDEMEKKKIAYVITQSELGGAQKHLLLLAKGLKEQYDITVYSKPGGKMVEELLALKIKYIPVNSMVREINLLEDFKTYKFLTNEFKQNNYDIVHSHSSKAGLIARLAANKVKTKKIIYTAHGFVFNEPMSKIKKTIYKIIERFAARLSDNIICVSPDDVEISKVVGIKPKSSIEYIPNGIEFEENSKESRLEIRKRLKLEQNEFIFGFVANFYETKGHRYLIEGFNNFIKNGYQAKLVLIGEGNLISEMKVLAKENKNIEFLGFKPNACELIKAFDCFIMSSVKEGFPFVLLEAAYNKVPIITTEVGAIYEMLDGNKNGIVVPPKDSQAIYNAMKYAIKNKESMNVNAESEYDYCKNMYSLEKMVSLTRDLYENK